MGTHTSAMHTVYTTREIEVSTATPCARDLQAFITEYARRGLTSSESLTVCLIYIQRLQSTGVQLLARNWRPILLAALILSTKMVDDMITWNKEFQSNEFRVHKVNLLEMNVLKSLDYRLFVGAKEYARYHFALRKLAETKPTQQLLFSKVRGVPKVRSRHRRLPVH